MNLLKNLLILAVLAAVGYGIYVSLTRNNVDPDQPPGVAEGWPAGPKVELPSAKPSPPPGGPLALGGTAVRPAAGPARASAKRRRRLCLRRAAKSRQRSAGRRAASDARHSVSFLGSLRPRFARRGHLGSAHVAGCSLPRRRRRQAVARRSAAGRNGAQPGSAARSGGAQRRRAASPRQPPPTASCRASSPPSWTPCKRISTRASWPTPISRSASCMATPTCPPIRPSKSPICWTSWPAR